MLTLPNDPRMSPPHRSDTRRSIRRHLLAIGAGAIVLVFGIGTLGAKTELAGAIVASGSLVVQSSVKKVQHQTGGTVGALLVGEGTHVKAGDIMLHLDETVASATLSALTKDYYELLAQHARLDAEANGTETIAFSRDILNAIGDPEVARIVASEMKLFGLRRNARNGQKNQLHQRIAQMKNEIDGLREQTTAKNGELSIVHSELTGVKELYDRNLVQLTRLDALQRDAMRIAGERGALTAQMAQTQGRIAETELQIIQIDADMRSEVARQQGEVRSKTADLVGHMVASLDQMQHLDIRAPQNGVVHELAVHGKGAVIAPGETIMLIVPDADKLVVEVRVAPQDIDQVGLDQIAMLRFPNFNQRTTPEVTAHVSRIAADTTQDQRSGVPYYLVQIGLPADAPIAAVSLRPGMPVDAFIKTSDRTLLSYLVKPLADQMSRTFREK